MAPPSRKPSATAEVSLVSLKNCLVNLPASLVSALSNADAVAQNVVIELQYKSHGLSSNAVANRNDTGLQKSAYVGWTGMPSRPRPGPVPGRRGYTNGTKEQEVAAVEIDTTFAGILGLTEGQKVGIFLHMSPPVAQSVNIEPLTPSDWEVIELHANFLELNLLSQVRVLPNPNYSATASVQAQHSHPLTLHLSPTSTVKVIVTSLTPLIPNSSPFAKIAPDAEVIVAPKVRARATRSVREDDRSIASTSRKSTRSAGGALRSRNSVGADFLLVRGVDRGVCHEWFSSETEEDANEGLCVWVHPDAVAKEALDRRKWISVSIVRPAGLRTQLDQHQIQQLKDQDSSEAGFPSPKMVAQLKTWTDAPDDKHAALSSQLCSTLGFQSIVGCITKLEPAPSPLQRSEVKAVKFYPFLPDSASKKEGLKFGGESKLSREVVTHRVKEFYGSEHGLLQGPVTDGMLLPPPDTPNPIQTFSGGILRFLSARGKSGEKTLTWLLGSEHNLVIDTQPEIPKTMVPTTIYPTFDPGLPKRPLELVGIGATIKACLANLRLCSSILLTGGIGSGKTNLSHFLCQRLRESHLFYTTYFSCRKLVTDETRVSNIKNTLLRLFMSASWCARLGGQSIVVLDDLDKICPVETELQVGNDNGRSRLITEIFCSIVRHYCTPRTGIALLATAQSKDSLNHLIISGHVVGEIISLKAPDKEARRKMLSKFTSQNTKSAEHDPNSHIRRSSNNSSNVDQDSWMDPTHSESFTPPTEGITLSPSVDLLELAGRTDGFMAGDLSLLVTRARNECLTRIISSTTTENPNSNSNNPTTHLTLLKSDFTTALQNFTPTSLRNVPLTHSTQSFSSIGGLHSTRITLLETLAYPTKYAPIFAASPLRLRSGILLYGYPGCGKTLLASAVAGECGLNFISVKGPEILNKYIGASEKSVRDLFERAQAAKPCILFFDEFDSVAPKRGHDSTGVTDRVVNQLLTQMDGAEGLEGVYVLAATSRPDLIDPALLRPGRLDKSLLCDMPGQDDRVDILKAISKKLVLEAGVEDRLEEVAERTHGFSGADLQALMYNAHLDAVHELIGDSFSTEKKEKGKMGNGTTKKAKRTPETSKSGNKNKHDCDFIQFLHDPTLDAEARASSSTSNNVLEPPSIIAEKLAEMKRARKAERYHQYQSHHPSSLHNNPSKNQNRNENGGEEKQEVIITWTNIERSLSSTRSSISGAERRRLEGIYREFVVGRNGEMPTGEGSGGREVGGRSSLM